MEEIKKLKYQLEYIFMKKIINGLRDKSLSIPQSKIVAQAFMKMLPFTSHEDATIKIHAYVNKYPAFISLKEYIDSYEQEKKVTDVVNKMRKYIRTNNVDKALEIAKDY